MGLYERIISNDTDKISVHPFCCAMREVTRGNITKAQVISYFGLDSSDQSNFDSMVAHYQALDAVEKQNYIMQIHDVFILCEAGIYTKIKAEDALGL